MGKSVFWNLLPGDYPVAGRVAPAAPPGAIMPWEGVGQVSDDSRHGGIYNALQPAWYVKQVLPIQHGNTASLYRDLDDGSPIAVRNP